METMETAEKEGASPGIQIKEQNFVMRRLEPSDYTRGFLELLGQLSVCGNVSQQEFTNRFQELQGLGDDYVISVIEDTDRNRIVATGTIFVERKFLRTCGKVGHIEDVVVDSSARGKHLGHKILRFLTEHARVNGCYKVILDCSVENQGFYEKFGFKKKEVQMALYFE
uniref:Glucosamine 6-phosphate N-acetyltransferase n=1 Tax=Araucaria cunninghamii TaxID=56994 RepID=A0A0D6QTG4_ARACU